jgi:hypothetical protein
MATRVVVIYVPETSDGIDVVKGPDDRSSRSQLGKNSRPIDESGDPVEVNDVAVVNEGFEAGDPVGASGNAERLEETSLGPPCVGSAAIKAPQNGTCSPA